MGKRVVILIDGQNLFYGLKQLNIQERDIKWNDLFKSLLEPADEMIRAYWFRPQPFPYEAKRIELLFELYNK